MRKYLFCMMLTGMLMVLAGRAPGADIYVATNGTGGAATNWSTAYTNIQTALDNSGSNDTIYIAGHTFLLTNQLNWTNCSGVTILGGYAATNDVSLPGEYNAGLWPTIIARDSGSIRIMYIGYVTNSLLERVTITGGDISGTGGGIYIDKCEELTISSCLITNNTVTSEGGGIYSGESWVTITNCLVSRNTGGGGMGGAIYFDSGTTLTLIDLIVSYNTGSRGAWLNTIGGTCLARNCLVYGNSAYVCGGAIYKEGGSVRLENCTVAYNSVSGIHNYSGTLTVTNSIIWGNGNDIYGTVTLAYSDIEDGDDNGNNGNICANPLFEYGFYLPTNSPCVDAGTNAAYLVGSGYTTRTDGSNDTGIVDMGYHYTTGFVMTCPDLYVAESGYDTNNGTSWAQAFRTIGEALSQAAGGTRIHVGQGNYTNGLETFPLVLADKTGLQLLGTNSATTIINASGSNQRVITATRSIQAKIANLTITGGDVSGTGGGMYTEDCADLTISSCLITNNTATLEGGGIYSGESWATITNCLVSKNTGGGGMAGAIYYDSATTLTLIDMIASYNTGSRGAWLNGFGTCLARNCLVYGNSASVCGDAIYKESGSVSLENCTVAYNDGQGIYNYGGTTTITNSIIWGNGDDIVGTVTLAYSDIEDGDNNTTNGCISIDPLFVDTNTADYRLEKSSPCINKGINLAWMIGAGDLDGNPRINSKTVDMGAYEVQLPPAGTMFMCR